MNRWITITLASAAAVVITTGVAAAGPAIPLGHNGTAVHATAPAAHGAPAAIPAGPLRPTVSETRFVPVTPCRAIDTRGTVGRLVPGDTYAFHLRGTANFPAQGGHPGGCGVPAAATGVAVSVSSVDIAGTGYLRIWPYGIPDPGATIAHYQAGPISTTGGTVTLPATSPGGNDVTAETFQSGAGLVVDVTGYYVVPMQAEIAPDGSVYATTGPSRIVSTTHPDAGQYVVTLDRPVTGCAVTATVAAGPYFASAFVDPSGTVTAQTWQIGQGGATPLDLYWYLTVTC